MATIKLFKNKADVSAAYSFLKKQFMEKGTVTEKARAAKVADKLLHVLPTSKDKNAQYYIGIKTNKNFWIYHDNKQFNPVKDVQAEINKLLGYKK